MKELSAREWLDEIEREGRAHQKYRDRAEEVLKRYEDEDKRKDSKFNILWSNTEVMHSALYARTPNPDIRRRYLDRDKAGKQASELAERAVSYAMDVYDFDGTIDFAIDEYLIAGIGQVRIRYEPYFNEVDGPPVYLEAREKSLAPDGEMTIGYFNGDEEITEFETDESGFAFIQGEPVEELEYEEVICEPVSWRRFRWMPCARWEDCDWVVIEHLKDADELKDEYPDHYTQIPMGFTEKGQKMDEGKDDKGYAMIYEIFDKVHRKQIEIADGLPEKLKETEDPLKLEKFYPFPKPLITTTKSGKFVPIPDYFFYQDQANELDRITDRINQLVAQLRYRGVYDASFKELLQIENAEDGRFIAVDNFSKIVNASGQGDISKVIAEVPTDGIIRAIQALYVAREQVKQTIYEITGIADIMRGATDADETLGAQQIKTQFGSMRLGKRQRKVQQFIRDIVKLKVEVMVENFQPQTLEMMTGIELEEEVYSILKNDMMRSYRIDIETDSTIAEDANQEKQNRIELVRAVTEFAGVVAPLVQQGYMPSNVATELLGFAVRGFKVGRTLEDTLDEMREDDDPRMRALQTQFQQAAQQMQQQAEARVGEIQQEASKQIEGLQKKLFDTEKRLAVNNAVNEAKMFETQTKGTIQKSTEEYKTQLNMMLEVFKQQIQADQEVPYQRDDNLGAVINQVVGVIDALEQRNSQTMNAVGEQFNALAERLAQLEDYQNRPVKVLRDKNGRVTGAQRE